MNGTPEKLYHYTSVETLLLILGNKTLRFNNLANMDDPEEAEAKDIYLPGRLCYVSCWTDDSAESIPMWSMYGGRKLDGVKLDGIRLEMPVFPFKKYVFPAGTVSNDEELESYINITQRVRDDLPLIPASMPLLVEVDYTNREELIHPRIKDVRELKNGIEYSIDFAYIGAFKRKVWAFQREWRYKLMVAPNTPSEFSSISDPEESIIFMKRLEGPEYQPIEPYIDLELDDKALSKAVILLGPNVSAADENRIRATAAACGLGITIERSKIRFRP